MRDNGYIVRIPSEFKGLMKELERINNQSVANILVNLAMGRGYRQGVDEKFFPVPPTVSVEVFDIPIEHIRKRQPEIRNFSGLGDK